MIDMHSYSCMGEEHLVLHREGEKVEARVAFVLSDKNFSLSLPSSVARSRQPSLPLQPRTTAILEPSTATFHKYTFFMLF
jgi:hypothetical protein